MYSIKYFFVSLFILISLSAFSQNTDAVFMKWKINPGEVISYKTCMVEIDTANRKDFDMSAMSKLLPGDLNDTSSRKFFKKLGEMALNDSLVTHLKSGKNKLIQIEMLMKNDKSEVSKDTTRDGKTASEMQEMMAKMTSGVMLRGDIDEDGKIVSFYTKNEQKNLIAVFFELPGRPVKIGDTWPLTINFLSMDQNFICDSSYRRNNVTVMDIKSINNEHIVTLKYDIIEYVSGDFNSPFNTNSIKTMMKMTYQGIADFSVERGGWAAYNGVMSLSSTGIMTSQTTKRLSLVQE
jgi:hypothetical protein